MKRRRTSRLAGVSLVETILAVAVLAVAIPLVFAALAESGRSGLTAEAETHSTWMVPVCLQELAASRTGTARFFPATAPGAAVPPAGEIWALGMGADDQPLGKLALEEYRNGTREIRGRRVRYIARMTLAPAADRPGMLASVSLEFPAAAPAARRQKLDFPTRLP